MIRSLGNNYCDVNAARFNSLSKAMLNYLPSFFRALLTSLPSHYRALLTLVFPRSCLQSVIPKCSPRVYGTRIMVCPSCLLYPSMHVLCRLHSLHLRSSKRSGNNIGEHAGDTIWVSCKSVGCYQEARYTRKLCHRLIGVRTSKQG